MAILANILIFICAVMLDFIPDKSFIASWFLGPQSMHFETCISDHFRPIKSYEQRYEGYKVDIMVAILDFILDDFTYY